MNYISNILRELEATQHEFTTNFANTTETGKEENDSTINSTNSLLGTAPEGFIAKNNRVWVMLIITGVVICVMYPILFRKSSSRITACTYRIMHGRWDVSDVEQRMRNSDRHMFAR